MKPITRKEQFIQAAAEGTDQTLTREELILSGADVTPLTREEYFAEMQGGGGGDVTEANVTVTIGNKSLTINGAFLMYTDEEYYSKGTISFTKNTSIMLKTALYKGKARVDIPSAVVTNNDISVSGNATYNNAGTITITGDCQIVFTAKG